MADYDPNYIPVKSYALIGQKAIILNKEDKILLLQRSEKAGAGGKWSLPGGGLDHGEDPIEGMKREIIEETELSVTELKPVNLRSYITDEKDFLVIVGYVAKAVSENVRLNWEHDKYKWLTLEEALKLELTEGARYFLSTFKK